MPKYTVIKFCKTCEGRGEVEVTLNYGEEEQKQTLPCPFCHGKGNHLWGWITDEDLGMPSDFYKMK